MSPQPEKERIDIPRRTVHCSISATKPVDLHSTLPSFVSKSKQTLESFQSFHESRDFPVKMRKYEKEAFKINFHKKMTACEKKEHSQSVEKLASTMLQGKTHVNEPPTLYLNRKQALAAGRLSQALREYRNFEDHKPLKLFKNVVVREESSGRHTEQ